MPEDSATTKLTYFLVGAGIGAVVALLFAPKSGRELRGDIADATKKSVEYTQENARLLGAKASELYSTSREKASQMYETGREKTNTLLETGREAVTDHRQRVAAAIEAGKRAYQEKKGEAKVLESSLAADATEN